MISSERMQAFLEGTATPTESELAFFEELAPGSRKRAESFIWDMLKGKRVKNTTINAALARDLKGDMWDQLEFLVAFLYEAKLRSDAVDVVRANVSINRHLRDLEFDDPVAKELGELLRNWSPSPAQRQARRR